MPKSALKNNTNIFLSFIIGAVLIFFTQQNSTNRLATVAHLYAPPLYIERFTLGYNENAADGLWLRVIQDMDHCDVNETHQKSASDCTGVSRGWVYNMMDAVTRLAPNFLIVYQLGATTLSVVIHDSDGAEALFQRGIEKFPNNWQLLYNAAYHSLYSLHDEKRAAELLTRAADNGAPKWVYALAAKLYTKEGQAFLAKTVLKRVLDQDPDSQFAPRLRLRLAELDKILKDSNSEPSRQ